MRIPYTADPPPADTSAEDLQIVERVRARRAPRPLQPLDLALLHAPPVADGWNSFLGAVRTRTTLPASVRELAISRVAVVNGAWYEWGHHAPLAAEAGVSQRALDDVVKGVPGELTDASVSPEAREAVGLGAAEWAVLQVTDEMTRHVKVRDETFAELRKHFNEREVVEVVATVSAYNCVSRFLVALDVGEKNGAGPDDVHH
ncbi:4-carboxymuconolactone decarboxylase family protein [Apiospora kogelbergensis]|uniref:4-carboxymuconolactone decarboxylase family protein n=1 Tax=Apiospora kogelbergensis TaxID=1337665 RepID=A0AAW0QEY7_9PEZI